jgi:antitoxin component YwqK of YwqJK toxin-antitoxin module
MSNYYSNGKIQSEGKYVNDLKHGVFKIYDKDGKVLKQEKFAYNKKVK